MQLETLKSCNRNNRFTAITICVRWPAQFRTGGFCHVYGLTTFPVLSVTNLV